MTRLQIQYFYGRREKREAVWILYEWVLITAAAVSCVADELQKLNNNIKQRFPDFICQKRV